MHQDIQEVLFDEATLVKRCKELANAINADYVGKSPILIGLLRGSVPFMAELMKYITLDIRIDFMDVSSYDGAQSSGVIKIDKDTSSPVKDRDIIIVEDIVDTGKTLKEVVSFLKQKGASSIKIVALLDKPSRRSVDIQADYVGFTIANEFVVGFGLDYCQRYRNLPYIGILKHEIYE